MSYLLFIKNNKVFTAFALFFIVLFGSLTIVKINGHIQPSENSEDQKKVTVIMAKDLKIPNTIILESGIIEALEQVELKSQMSGQIERVNAGLGDTVSAGQVIVGLKSDDLTAQLSQAQAGSKAQEARLEEMKKGARQEDLQIAQTTLSQAQQDLKTAIEDAYAKSDDAIRNHANKFFANPYGSSPDFQISLSNGQSQIFFDATDPELEREVNFEKPKLEKMLASWKERIGQETAFDDISGESNLSKQNIESIIGFVSKLATLVNAMETSNPSFKQQLDGYKSEISQTRSASNQALQTLLAMQTKWKLSRDALDLKLAGSSPEQIQQQEAAVAASQAQIDAIKAQLEKTKIISPFNGKISYLDARTGELASPGQLLASVVNPNALQLKTYASESDFGSFSSGDEALIAGKLKGRVFRISPAIDPQNKKIEVIIAVENYDRSNEIVIGQTASAEIFPKSSKESGSIYLVPLEAVRITPDGSFVFLISQEGKAFLKSVETGKLVGEKIEITSGLEDGMAIISQSRGLEDEERVTLENEQ